MSCSRLPILFQYLIAFLDVNWRFLNSLKPSKLVGQYSIYGKKRKIPFLFTKKKMPTYPEVYKIEDLGTVPLEKKTK